MVTMSGRIPDDFIRDVFDRTNLVELIGSYISLKRAGTGFKGLCPFHKENTPSFQVHPDRGFFYCFGCGKGGDSARFLMEMHGHSFPEAVTSLAERAGLTLPESVQDGPMQRGGRVDRKSLSKALALAQEFYELSSRQTPALAQFCRQRGLGELRSAEGPSVAETFGLGLAPDSWDKLTLFLKQKGVSADIADEAGLIIARKDNSGWYDRFRNRIMFPIFDLSGRVVGFSGRTLSEDPKAAKYVNSPETPLYRKSKLLYGLTQARDTIRTINATILVEGNVDVVRLHAAGFTQTVAGLGTALTSEQATILARFAPTTTLFYDGDKAGALATFRAVPILLSAGLDVRVARPPQGQDPADLAEKGVRFVQEALDSAMPAVHYITRFLQDDLGNSTAAKGQILTKSLEAIAHIPEEASARAAAWVVYRNLGLDRGVTDRELNQRLYRARSALRKREQSSRNEGSEEGLQEDPGARDSPAAPMSGIERHMGALMLAFPQFAPRFVDDGGIGLIEHTQLRTLIAQLAGTKSDEPIQRGITQLKADLVFSTPAPEQDGIESVYLQLLRNLERNGLEKRSLMLNPEIDLAESTGDTSKLNELRREKLEISQRIRELDSANDGTGSAQLPH